MASKKDTTPSKRKDKYRIRNWHEYNQSLVNRGSITFWFDENAIGNWYSIERSDKPGRPETYSDDAIRRMQECGEEGRSRWKEEVGYHRRSRVETLMFRYKTVLGDRLSARREQTQAAEVRIKLDVLNRMVELGMLKSYKVAI